MHGQAADAILKAGLTMIAESLQAMNLEVSAAASASASSAAAAAVAATTASAGASAADVAAAAHSMDFGASGSLASRGSGGSDMQPPPSPQAGCITLAQLGQRVLETLANWSTDTADASDAGGAEVTQHRFQLLAKGNFVGLLLAKLQQLRGGAEWALLDPDRLAHAREVRFRILCCLQNLALNLPPGLLGLSAHVQGLWNHCMSLLLAAGAETGSGAAASAVGAASAAPAAVAAASGGGGGGSGGSAGGGGGGGATPEVVSRDDAVQAQEATVSSVLVALLARPELDDEFDIRPQDLDIVVRVLCHSASSEARANGATMIGAMCAFIEDSAELVKAGQVLLRLCEDASMLVVAEALNAMYDGLGDDSCVSVRKTLQLATALRALRSTLTRRAQNADELIATEDQVERVQDVVSNLPEFISHVSR
jgi:hypothetical protein